jgi:hypothetical protein
MLCGSRLRVNSNYVGRINGLPAPALAAAAFAVAVVPAAAATAGAATATFETAAAKAAIESAAAATAAAVSATAAAAIAIAAAPASAEAASAGTAAATKTAATTRAAAAETAAAAGEAARLRLEAVAAVDGPITPRFEGNLRFFSTRCACRIEQLARRTIGVESAAPAFTVLLLLQPPAVWTPPRLPRETLAGMKLLFTRGEHERLAAIAANERLVGVRHPMDLLD